MWDHGLRQARTHWIRSDPNITCSNTKHSSIRIQQQINTLRSLSCWWIILRRTTEPQVAAQSLVRTTRKLFKKNSWRKPDLISCAFKKTLENRLEFRVESSKAQHWVVFSCFSSSMLSQWTPVVTSLTCDMSALSEPVKIFMHLYVYIYIFLHYT